MYADKQFGNKKKIVLFCSPKTNLYLLKHTLPTMIEEKIFYGSDSCFNVREFHKEEIGIGWHSHPEFELVYIESGKGKKLIGESMQEFGKNDLTLIGPNTPHLFIFEKTDIPNLKNDCHWWVIQFSSDIFSSKLIDSEAFLLIKKMLEASNYGIHFQDPKTKKQVFDTMKKMSESMGIVQLTSLYLLLNQLSNEKNISIMSEIDLETPQISNNEIVDKVYSYLLSNFNKQVTLEEIASLVHLRPTTLCSYYKRHTLKSIIETLIEIRISFACKLLVNSSQTINQIAYDSGFRNLSNFNRQFLKYKKMPPFEYRKRFRELNSEAI